MRLTISFTIDKYSYRGHNSVSNRVRTDKFEFRPNSVVSSETDYYPCCLDQQGNGRKVANYKRNLRFLSETVVTPHPSLISDPNHRDDSVDCQIPYAYPECRDGNVPTIEANPVTLTFWVALIILAVSNTIHEHRRDDQCY